MMPPFLSWWVPVKTPAMISFARSYDFHISCFIDRWKDFIKNPDGVGGDSMVSGSGSGRTSGHGAQLLSLWQPFFVFIVFIYILKNSKQRRLYERPYEKRRNPPPYDLAAPG